MEIKSDDKRKVLTYCNEYYQLSRIRSVKLAREIASGTQKRLDKWDF